MTEKQFMSGVVKLAGLLGWLCYHTHDSRRSVPGFPDLVLVRERVLFRELKTVRGRVSGSQQAWLDALSFAGADVGVWRPTDWDRIEGELRLCK